MPKGKAQEKVFDVACSDGGKVDPKTQRCADNGATVDVKTCKYTDNKGDAEISGAWSDPEFDPKLNAFYYARDREPDLPLVDLGRQPARHRAQPGAAEDDPGARVYRRRSGSSRRKRRDVASGPALGAAGILKRVVREPLVHFSPSERRCLPRTR